MVIVMACLNCYGIPNLLVYVVTFCLGKAVFLCSVGWQGPTKAEIFCMDFKGK